MLEDTVRESDRGLVIDSIIAKFLVIFEEASAFEHQTIRPPHVSPAISSEPKELFKITVI